MVKICLCFSINFPYKLASLLLQRHIKSKTGVSKFGAWYCMHAKLFQSCLILQPGSTVHGILQVRILEWVAISFSRESSQPRAWTYLSYVTCTGMWILYHLHHLKPSLNHINLQLTKRTFRYFIIILFFSFKIFGLLVVVTDEVLLFYWSGHFPWSWVKPWGLLLAKCNSMIWNK